MLSWRGLSGSYERGVPVCTVVTATSPWSPSEYLLRLNAEDRGIFGLKKPRRLLSTYEKL